MRLIDADEAKHTYLIDTFDTADDFERTNDILEYAPTIDAVLAVHGRWMHEETEGGFHSWRCSRCGRGMNDNPEGIDLYCYHCGARMDGDAE